MLGRARNNNSEHEAKFIQERITTVERSLAEICHAFGAYSRKAARLRDKGDELSRLAISYSEQETINKSLSNGVAKFAGAMTTISDYGDKRVQYIDNKIVNELGQYETICKSAREEVKQIFVARDKEVLRKRQLDRIRERNPRNRQQIIQAETELVQATADVSRTMHSLEEQVTTFERQKLHDIKAILLDFLSTEIGFHAKAIENLTLAYRDIDGIDEDADLEEFKRAMRLPDTIPHNTRRPLFKTARSFGSLGSLFSTPRKDPTGIPGIKGKGIKSPTRSKSEDELDKHKGIYDEVGDTEEDSDESETERSEKSEESEQKHVSPFVAKRYLK